MNQEYEGSPNLQQLADMQSEVVKWRERHDFSSDVNGGGYGNNSFQQDVSHLQPYPIAGYGRNSPEPPPPGVELEPPPPGVDIDLLPPPPPSTHYKPETQLPVPESSVPLQRTALPIHNQIAETISNLADQSNKSKLLLSKAIAKKRLAAFSTQSVGKVLSNPEEDKTSNTSFNLSKKSVMKLPTVIDSRFKEVEDSEKQKSIQRYEDYSNREIGKENIQHRTNPINSHADVYETQSSSISKPKFSLVRFTKADSPPPTITEKKGDYSNSVNESIENNETDKQKVVVEWKKVADKSSRSMRRKSGSVDKSDSNNEDKHSRSRTKTKDYRYDRSRSSRDYSERSYKRSRTSGHYRYDRRYSRSPSETDRRYRNRYDTRKYNHRRSDKYYDRNYDDRSDSSTERKRYRSRYSKQKSYGKKKYNSSSEYSRSPTPTNRKKSDHDKSRKKIPGESKEHKKDSSKSQIVANYSSDSEDEVKNESVKKSSEENLPVEADVNMAPKIESSSNDNSPVMMLVTGRDDKEIKWPLQFIKYTKTMPSLPYSCKIQISLELWSESVTNDLNEMISQASSEKGSPKKNLMNVEQNDNLSDSMITQINDCQSLKDNVKGLKDYDSPNHEIVTTSQNSKPFSLESSLHEELENMIYEKELLSSYFPASNDNNLISSETQFPEDKKGEKSSSSNDSEDSDTESSTTNKLFQKMANDKRQEAKSIKDVDHSSDSDAASDHSSKQKSLSKKKKKPTKKSKKHSESDESETASDSDDVEASTSKTDKQKRKKVKSEKSHSSRIIKKKRYNVPSKKSKSYHKDRYKRSESSSDDSDESCTSSSDEEHLDTPIESASNMSSSSETDASPAEKSSVKNDRKNRSKKSSNHEKNRKSVDVDKKKKKSHQKESKESEMIDKRSKVKIVNAKEKDELEEKILRKRKQKQGSASETPHSDNEQAFSRDSRRKRKKGSHSESRAKKKRISKKESNKKKDLKARGKKRSMSMSDDSADDVSNSKKHKKEDENGSNEENSDSESGKEKKKHSSSKRQSRKQMHDADNSDSDEKQKSKSKSSKKENNEKEVSKSKKSSHKKRRKSEKKDSDKSSASYKKSSRKNAEIAKSSDDSDNCREKDGKGIKKSQSKKKSKKGGQKDQKVKKEEIEKMGENAGKKIEFQGEAMQFRKHVISIDDSGHMGVIESFTDACIKEVKLANKQLSADQAGRTESTRIVDEAESQDTTKDHVDENSNPQQQQQETGKWKAVDISEESKSEMWTSWSIKSDSQTAFPSLASVGKNEDVNDVKSYSEERDVEDMDIADSEEDETEKPLPNEKNETSNIESTFFFDQSDNSQSMSPSLDIPEDTSDEMKLTAKQLLERVKQKRLLKEDNVTGPLGLKLKNPPTGYFGPKLPPELEKKTVLPLIGKLPAVKRGHKSEEDDQDLKPNLENVEKEMIQAIKKRISDKLAEKSAGSVGKSSVSSSGFGLNSQGDNSIAQNVYGQTSTAAPVAYTTTQTTWTQDQGQWIQPVTWQTSIQHFNSGYPVATTASYSYNTDSNVNPCHSTSEITTDPSATSDNSKDAQSSDVVKKDSEDDDAPPPPPGVEPTTSVQSDTDVQSPTIEGSEKNKDHGILIQYTRDKNVSCALGLEQTKKTVTFSDGIIPGSEEAEEQPLRAEIRPISPAPPPPEGEVANPKNQEIDIRAALSSHVDVTSNDIPPPPPPRSSPPPPPPPKSPPPPPPPATSAPTSSLPSEYQYPSQYTNQMYYQQAPYNVGYAYPTAGQQYDYSYQQTYMYQQGASAPMYYPVAPVMMPPQYPPPPGL